MLKNRAITQIFPIRVISQISNKLPYYATVVCNTKEWGDITIVSDCIAHQTTAQRCAQKSANFWQKYLINHVICFLYEYESTYTDRSTFFRGETLYM